MGPTTHMIGSGSNTGNNKGSKKRGYSSAKRSKIGSGPTGLLGQITLVVQGFGSDSVGKKILGLKLRACRIVDLSHP